MITDSIKAKAIALLQSSETARDVSEILAIPYMLVKEWESKLDLSDLTTLEANTNALEKVIIGEILSNTEKNKEMLRSKVEETAIKIVEAANENIYSADVIQSRSLQLLGNTISTLYKTILGENKTEDDPLSKGMTMLEQIGID